MKYAILSIVLLFYTFTPAVSGEYVGLVKPYFYGSNLYLRKESMTTNSQASCVTRGYLRFEEGSTNEFFKLKFSVILSAWMAQRPVKLVGIGNDCSSEGDEIIDTVEPM